MRKLTEYISEAQSEWEQKHDLINKLVKAGVAETSHLWLATMDELQDMAREAGIIDEAEIGGIKPITPGTSMTDKPNQPQGNAQTPQGVNPVSPAANIQIGSNPSTSSTMQQPEKPKTPQELQQQVKTMMQDPQIKQDFEKVLQQMVARAGIK